MNSRNRIAFFIPSMAGAGAERVALNLVQEFCAQGWKVDLLLNLAAGEFLPLIPKNVRIFELKSSGFFSKVVKVSQYLTAENPNFFISLLDRVNACGFAKQLSGWKGKLVVSIHSNTSSEFSAENGLLTRIKPLFMKFSYQFADSIVSVSEGSTKDMIDLLKLNPDKIHTIPNPIVTSSMIRQSKESLEHKWLGEEGVPVFVSVGRLVAVKDFSTLLKAFSVVRQKVTAKLVILGEGEEYGNLNQLASELKIENDVDFCGFVSNPYKYMAQSSVFVMSSVYEGFGNVIVEALAMGKAVVSTDCPTGPSEILEGGAYGQLVPVGDHVALSEAMITALKSEVDSEKLKARANVFSVEAISGRYVNLLASLVN